MINAINSLGLDANSVTSPVDASAGGDLSKTDFSTYLSNFLANSFDTLRQGEAAALDGLTGKAPLQEVVQKVMAAEQAMQAGIALRDKIVSAYLEISRMSI